MKSAHSELSPRRPWVAAILSLVQPGLGHLYVGRPWLALLPPLLGSLLFALLYIGAVYVPQAPFNVVLPLLLLVLVWLAVPIHAALVAKRTGKGYILRPYNRWYVYAGFFVVTGMVVSPALLGFVRGQLIQAFRIPSGAMDPTIRIGDFLYVVKGPAEQRRPSRGRIVVFEAVDEPGLQVVKRVVGMPGDTLWMRAGALVRNGRPLEEPYAVHVDPQRSEDPVQRAKMKEWQKKYLLKTGADYAPDLQDWGPLVVPADSFFGLGDNRDASYDSRYYGFIP
ncbi:MAG TPA: signal peptidase I, partial [Gemmatimonadales bacterium]|nr:signal peptidase I [Gemmatimonadales bacterium]